MWQSHKGGAQWRLKCDDRIELKDGLDHATDGLARYLTLDGDNCPRTKGQPRSVELLLEDFGEELHRAANEYNIPLPWMIALVLCESGRLKGSRLRRDPVSLRHEPGYESDEATPGKVSAGLGQTLLRTARYVAGTLKINLAVMVNGNLYEQDRAINVYDLYQPALSLMLMAGYMEILGDKWDMDPIIIQAAYNAGGAYTSSKNPYNLRMYGGSDRLIKFTAYHNDAVEVLHV